MGYCRQFRFILLSSDSFFYQSKGFIIQSILSICVWVCDVAVLCQGACFSSDQTPTPLTTHLRERKNNHVNCYGFQIAMGSKELLSSFLILMLFKPGVDVVSWSIVGLGWWGYFLIVQIMWPTLPLLSLQANFSNLPLPPKILPHFLPEKVMPVLPAITALGKQPERCDACVTHCHCSWRTEKCDACVTCCHFSWQREKCDACATHCHHSWQREKCDACVTHCHHSWQTEKCDACVTHCHRSWQTAREVWCLCDLLSLLLANREVWCLCYLLSPLLANSQRSVMPVWPTVTALGKQPGKCDMPVWPTVTILGKQRSVMPVWPTVTALGSQPKKCDACVTPSHRSWQTAREVWYACVTHCHRSWQTEKCDACVTCCHCSWQTARNISEWYLCKLFCLALKMWACVMKSAELGCWVSQLVVCWAGPYLRYHPLLLTLLCELHWSGQNLRNPT